MYTLGRPVSSIQAPFMTNCSTSAHTSRTDIAEGYLDMCRVTIGSTRRASSCCGAGRGSTGGPSRARRPIAEADVNLEASSEKQRRLGARSLVTRAHTRAGRSAPRRGRGSPAGAAFLSVASGPREPPGPPSTVAAVRVHHFQPSRHASGRSAFGVEVPSLIPEKSSQSSGT